jgi:hypothetical protein
MSFWMACGPSAPRASRPQALTDCSAMKQQGITSERWLQVKEIFQAAVDLPTAERKAYLTGACEGDPSLRAEIESLIEAHK